MKITLWILQALLALLFAMAGLFKLATPIDELVASGMTYAADYPWMLYLAGGAEVLGAIGLILPAATRIKPGLTPLAAAGLALVMFLAIGLHLVRGEFAALGGPAVLMALSVFVAWGRWKKAPITPRDLRSQSLELSER